MFYFEVITKNIYIFFLGLAKLFSVTKLHLDNNSVTSFHEILHLSKLPCIEILNLQNNPVTLNVDYRSQVLLIFGSHASEVSYKVQAKIIFQ